MSTSVFSDERSGPLCRLAARGRIRVDFFVALAGIVGLFSFAPAAGADPPAVSAMQRHAERQQEIDAYLAKHQVAYRWFADFPFGSKDGTPYLILKLLPKLAPDEWGAGKNFLDVVGLFDDERLPGYPIARGIGWSGLARDPATPAVDYASFTCGACHIGRVRHPDGGVQYLDGGINTQFNLVRYRAKIVRTIEQSIGPEVQPEKRAERFTARLLQVLDQVHAADPTYFYGNVTTVGRAFDAAYEAKQIWLFKQNTPQIVGKFLVRADLELRSLKTLVEKNYRGFETPMLEGFGGMADATGVSTSFGYLARKEIERDPATDPDLDLPPTAGLTDFMSVWRQSERKARWSEDRMHLVDGGGQWNGNIPVPVFRNLAAELTMGFGADTDVRIAALAVDLLDGLPPPPYPFDVDPKLASRGERLFTENCADCHRPNNGRVYSKLGTDLGRAKVVSPSIAARARRGFAAIGAPNREVSLPPDELRATPFAAFEGVSLADRSDAIMGDPENHLGYVALPLSGVWAAAPYLHNGSVPTLYHLLMPRERPAAFIKGRLDYDPKHVGFSWSLESPSPATSEGYRFDTAAHTSVSPAGHDRDVIDDGKTYRLDWSADRDSALAIIEYLKTR